MTEHQNQPAQPARIAMACILAWMVPGAGHLFLKRFGRAAIFFVSIISLFILGILQDGELFTPDFSEFFAALKFFAESGAGLVYIGSVMAGIGAGQITSLTYDFGCIFLYGAGLLNMLILLDAFDIGMGRKN